tara:strand:+ start:11 stop:223 length:213 start_codon:yes stop_codon:yes gene_type:complete
MLGLRNSTINVIVIYSIIGYLIWNTKPLMFFDESGKMKSFGLGTHKTVFYYPLILVFISIIVFYMFELKN